MPSYIDERFCNPVGTDKQHSYICKLASSAGYSSLRGAVADALGINVSKCSKRVFTIKDASKVIEYLLAKK